MWAVYRTVTGNGAVAVQGRAIRHDKEGDKLECPPRGTDKGRHH